MRAALVATTIRTGVAGLVGAVSWSASATPSITQATQTGDFACKDLTITSQAPFATATGANRSPGNIIFTIPAPVGAGTDGQLRIWFGASQVYFFAKTSFQMTAALVAFGAGVSAPKISQLDNTANGATAQTLTIQAANATGTTSTGGSLILSSGSGTTTAANVFLSTGGTARFAVAPTYLYSYVNAFLFGANTANAAMTHQAQTADAACTNFTFTSQGPWASATGTNRNPGNMIHAVPAPAAGGTAGYHSFTVSGTEVLRLGAAAIGFYNTAPAAKPTVTGSRGSNAALTSLCSALATLGLITDSTS